MVADVTVHRGSNWPCPSCITAAKSISNNLGTRRVTQKNDHRVRAAPHISSQLVKNRCGSGSDGGGVGIQKRRIVYCLLGGALVCSNDPCSQRAQLAIARRLCASTSDK